MCAERSTHRGLRTAGSAAVVAGVVAVASAAWACVPAPQDKQTKVSSCAAPAGATKECKTPVGAPTFPDATFVKGPLGSSFVAYVTGPGMSTGLYNLVFATKPQLAGGQPCNSSASVVLAGPLMANNGAISATSGRIPTDSPLGLSQVCFIDVTRGQTNGGGSTPAQFKVMI